MCGWNFFDWFFCLVIRRSQCKEQFPFILGRSVLRQLLYISMDFFHIQNFWVKPIKTNWYFCRSVSKKFKFSWFLLKIQAAYFYPIPLFGEQNENFCFIILWYTIYKCEKKVAICAINFRSWIFHSNIHLSTKNATLGRQVYPSSCT